MNTFKQLSLFDKAGLLILLIYTGFCAYYSMERVCFADTSYMFFKIVRDTGFNVEAGRYPQILTQLLLVPARFLGLPLNALMFIYSISFPLLYIVCAGISTFVYGFKKASWALVFALTGGLGLAFFHTGTETHQSIAWGIVFFSWMQSSKPDFVFTKACIRQLVWGILFATLTLHSHPVGLFFLVFTLIYYWLNTRQFKRPEPYIILCVIVFLSLIKLMTTDTNSYEGQFFSQITEFPELIKQLDSNYTFHYFKYNINTTYHIYLIVFVLGICFLFLKKSFVNLLFYCLFPFGFVLFTILIYHQGDSDLMMQRAFLPLGYFIAIPILNKFELHQNNLIKSTQLIFVFLIYFACFWMISFQGNVMEKRFVYMDELHVKFNASRMYLNCNDVDMKRVGVQWSFCLESLLYSSAKYGNDKTFMIAVYNDTELKREEIYSNKVLISHESFGRINFLDLNNRYYNFDKSLYQSPKFIFP
jgi:hypothetical protein